MLISFFYHSLGNSESFCETTFTFKFNIDATERSDWELVWRVVDLHAVLVSTVRFFFPRPEVELTSSRRLVGVVAHRTTNAVDFIVKLSARDQTKEEMIERDFFLEMETRHLHFLTRDVGCAHRLRLSIRTVKAFAE